MDEFGVDDAPKAKTIKVSDGEIRISAAIVSNYTVTMWTDETANNHYSRRHLPTFLMPACSPSEAIIKIRAMFPESLKIGGKVMRTEPHCDREMDF